jgi:hypothetical protein
MMRAAAEARLDGERGGVLVMLAIWLPILVLFIVFVVDVGNWFLHKRHLQMQADAGALAGGGLFTFPCADGPIEDAARKYGGDPNHAAPYNLQVAPTNQGNVHLLVNSEKYWNEGGTDYSDGGPPCSARRIDVKITEASLPWFFGLQVVPAINAHARVEIRALRQRAGALPVAVPDVNPAVGRATFIDETTGTTIASTPLTKTGFANGLATWDNSAAPVSVPISSERIGVRVALGGGASTTCGDPLVACYDLGSANGILYVRGWSSSGTGAQPGPPVARSVTLFPGSCSDPYFSADASTCTIGVTATVAFGGGPTAVGARVTALVAGAEKPLTYDAASGTWSSTAGNLFSVSPGAGPVPVELKWEETVGVQGGNTCRTGGGNKCKGTFGVVQRAFGATELRSGPIKLAQIWEGPSFWANSFQLGTTHGLVVKIGVVGNLQNASSVNDPQVLLRVTGSQNQSVDCDPNVSNLRDEIAQGCAPSYAVNAGSACPATAPALWSQPQPWNCVAIQTGGAVGQVEHGMKDRILGGANTCTSPNNWSLFPNIPPGDPRIVPIFLTPFGTFMGSGNEVVPVTGFATFYVTGWFGSPCSTDDPVNDKGYVVGHFIKYVYTLNNGGGSEELCDFAAFGSCIAVLTE